MVTHRSIVYHSARLWRLAGDIKPVLAHRTAHIAGALGTQQYLPAWPALEWL
jgi:hypothetical protein